MRENKEVYITYKRRYRTEKLISTNQFFLVYFYFNKGKRKWKRFFSENQFKGKPKDAPYFSTTLSRLWRHARPLGREKREVFQSLSPVSPANRFNEKDVPFFFSQGSAPRLLVEYKYNYFIITAKRIEDSTKVYL